MWLNSDMGERILSSILAYCRFPDQTFVGSPESIDALKQALEQENRGKPNDSTTGVEVILIDRAKK